MQKEYGELDFRILEILENVTIGPYDFCDAKTQTKVHCMFTALYTVLHEHLPFLLRKTIIISYTNINLKVSLSWINCDRHFFDKNC